MKIVYCGNFSQTHCTEVHLALTLEDLGHSVKRLQENEYYTSLARESEGYDMFLWTRTWQGHVTQEMLDELSIPSVSYHLDLYVGLNRADGLDFDPFWRTDYVFTPDGDPQSAKAFKAKKINHFYMKPGVYKGDCYMVDNPKTKDVIFVGSKGYHAEWPYRPKLIEWLRDTYGSQFEHWGADGLGTIRNDPLNQLYGSTKVVVGDSLVLPGHTYYWSDRAYETLGRGGFLIHPHIKGMEEEFRSGVHLRFYELGNFKQLKYLIDHYLANDTEREGIRLKGHQFVKNHATYHQRLKRMLDIVGQREAKI